jgi:hypothetical protein
MSEEILKTELSNLQRDDSCKCSRYNMVIDALKEIEERLTALEKLT